MLDEAMAGTLGGEYRRLDTVVFASCTMLAACQLAGDLDRANKWCRVADEFMNTFGCPFLYARCRTHYGGVLLAAGQWLEAEDQLQAALQMSESAGPGPRMDALAQLADLRLRQGRLEEAEALLALMDDTRDVTLAAAAVRMARGEPAVAARILERRAKLLGERHIEAAATLAMLVEAHLGDGDLASARDVASASASWPVSKIAGLRRRWPCWQALESPLSNHARKKRSTSSKPPFDALPGSTGHSTRRGCVSS